jgi:hypothetical protein
MYKQKRQFMIYDIVHHIFIQYQKKIRITISHHKKQ